MGFHRFEGEDSSFPTRFGLEASASGAVMGFHPPWIPYRFVRLVGRSGWLLLLDGRPAAVQCHSPRL